MSSTSERQLPDAEIEALTAAVQVVTSKEKLLAKHVFNALLKLLNTSADISAGELIAELLRGNLLPNSCAPGFLVSSQLRAL